MMCGGCQNRACRRSGCMGRVYVLRAGLSLPAYVPPDLDAQARPPGTRCLALDRTAAPEQ